MKKDLVKLVLIITGATLFNTVFWQEKIALNMVLFDAFILFSLFYLYPAAKNFTVLRWLVLGHLVCLAMIVVHNTEISKIGFAITLLLLAAFAQYCHRSVWFASGSILLNFIFFVAGFFEETGKIRTKRIKRRSFSRVIRFAILPAILLVIFAMIYSVANSVFSNMMTDIGNKIEYFFSNFFFVFSWQRFLFLIAGLYITGSVLLKSKLNFFAAKESFYVDDLKRKKIRMWQRNRMPFYNLMKTFMGGFASGNMALKNENTVGIISLVLLNLLLLSINIIDINYVWLNFTYTADTVLYKLVHEGTELLILSIVLAMLVLLFFFKGNLNFYQRNKWLKYGAYAWVIQNVILVMSVFLRDYYYIRHHGLAYKRIGVLVFLLMVIIGLMTVLIKISLKKTNYFLFRVNAWAGLLILVLATTVHWDSMIASYNLAHQNKVQLDVKFLLSLSDKTLPILHQNMELLKISEQRLQSAADNSSSENCDTCFVKNLVAREKNFMKEQQQYTWLSWNYADEYVNRYFKKKANPIVQ